MKGKKVVIIDNYDSFTYNLVHIVEDILGAPVTVLRNDQFDMDELKQYEYIILSPGPGIPDEAGQLKAVIEKYKQSKKIMGVCLGLQAIGEVYGAKLINLKKVWHGMRTTMKRTESDSVLLAGVESEFFAGRYHSWVIDPTSDVSQLEITAIDDEGNIMAARHRDHNVFGVQFHPESIMTDDGVQMIKNFLKF